MSEGSTFLSFKRAKFKTRLPHGRLYTAGHMWLREADAGVWQVGLTRFALRMLGDPVDMDFEVQPDAEVERGDVVGWMEGFKALTELYTPLDGRFVGGNDLLESDIDSVNSSPYDRGWIFAVEGTPGSDCVETEEYAAVLDATIDKMLGAEGVNAEGKLE